MCTGWFNNCVQGGSTIVYRVVQKLCTGWFNNCLQGGSKWTKIVYRVVQQLCTGWFDNCVQGGLKIVYRVVQNEQNLCTGWFKMNKNFVQDGSKWTKQETAEFPNQNMRQICTWGAWVVLVYSNQQTWLLLYIYGYAVWTSNKRN